MGLGVPSVNIAFIEQSITAIQRGERGIIAMILTDAGTTRVLLVYLMYRIFRKC